MNKQRCQRFLIGILPWILAAAVTAAAAIFALWPAMGPGIALVSPDNPIDARFAVANLTFVNFINFVDPTAISHDLILKIIASPEFYNDWGYVICTVLLSLAMFCYLRALGLGKVSSIFGALAAALSGYHFTLFSAGHRGFFVAMPYVVFMLALIEHAVNAPRWYHFALLAFCAPVGIAYAPDVFLIMSAVLGVYALVRAASVFMEEKPREFKKKRAVKYAVGAAVLVSVFLLSGYPSVKNVFSVTLPSRKQQISETSGMTQHTETINKKSLNTGKNDRWEFATNWSLPPEDIVEFAVPCFRGYDSGNQEAPYWGRLGCPPIRPNYRQHTVYLGVLQLSFAFFAFVSALVFRRSGVRLRGVTFFWFAIAAAAVLLSLGRYTPFYKLFFAIPGCSYIRCPVKFVRVAELGIAILAAIGMDALIRADRKINTWKLSLRICLWSSLTAAIVCLMFAFHADIGQIAKKLAACGITNKTLIVRAFELYKNSLIRSGWLFTVAAITFGMFLFGALKSAADAKWRNFWCGAMVLLAAADMSLVARHFVHTIDCTPVLASQNDIVDDFKIKGGIDGSKFSYMRFTGGPIPSLPMAFLSLQKSGIYVGDPLSTMRPDEPSVVGLRKLGDAVAPSGGALKFWQFMGSNLILASPNNFMPLLKGRLASIIGIYSFDRRSGMFRRTVGFNSADLIALRPNSTAPSPAVFYSWRSVGDEKTAYDEIAKPEFDLTRQIIVRSTELGNSDSTDLPVSAKWLVRPSETGGMRGEIIAETDKPGVLFYRESLMSQSKFDVIISTKNAAGEKTAAVVPMKANINDWGIKIPAGRTHVTLKARVPLLNVLFYALYGVFSLYAFVLFIWELAGIKAPRRVNEA